MMGVMRGDKIEGTAPRTVEHKETVRWLADRAWGRAIQRQDVVKVDQHKVDHRWADYADVQLLALLDALENRVPHTGDRRRGEGRSGHPAGVSVPETMPAA